MNLLKVPCLVFYTDRFFKLFGKSWAAGMAFGPIIWIRPEHKHDIGLLEHEKVHVLQFWRTLGINGILYKFSAKWRFEYELEAYKRQLRHSSAPAMSAKLFASFIVDHYKLDELKLTKTAVVKALRGQ